MLIIRIWRKWRTSLIPTVNKCENEIISFFLFFFHQVTSTVIAIRKYFKYKQAATNFFYPIMKFVLVIDHGKKYSVHFFQDAFWNDLQVATGGSFIRFFFDPIKLNKSLYFVSTLKRRIPNAEHSCTGHETSLFFTMLSFYLSVYDVKNIEPFEFSVFSIRKKTICFSRKLLYRHSNGWKHRTKLTVIFKQRSIIVLDRSQSKLLVIMLELLVKTGIFNYLQHVLMALFRMKLDAIFDLPLLTQTILEKLNWILSSGSHNQLKQKSVFVKFYIDRMIFFIYFVSLKHPQQSFTHWPLSVHSPDGKVFILKRHFRVYNRLTFNWQLKPKLFAILTRPVIAMERRVWEL